MPDMAFRYLRVAWHPLLRRLVRSPKPLEAGVVIKAQVHAGGRGKAGGIKLVANPQEAEHASNALLGKRLVTHQTGLQGVPVGKVLVEEVAEQVTSELYLGTNHR